MTAKSFMSGSVVSYRDGDGRWRRGRATGPATWWGHDFEGVAVCSEAEWQAAQAEHRRPRTTRQPVTDVELAFPGTPRHFAVAIEADGRMRCDCGHREPTATDLEWHILAMQRAVA